jgi:hypothetical protein
MLDCDCCVLQLVKKSTFSGGRVFKFRMSSRKKVLLLVCCSNSDPWCSQCNATSSEL